MFVCFSRSRAGKENIEICFSLHSQTCNKCLFAATAVTDLQQADIRMRSHSSGQLVDDNSFDVLQQLVATIPIQRKKTRQTCLAASFNFTGFVATCQQIATNLSVSSNCNKSVKVRLVATCHLQTCYNLLKQLAASL